MSPKAAQRELIEPHSKDKRYVRRTKSGKLTESQDDITKSLSQYRQLSSLGLS